MTPTATPPERLAAALAARILHDLSSPASGVAAGLDLLAESGHGDGAPLELAVSSAKSLLDLLEFHKVAFGGGAEPVADATLRRLALTPFEAGRPRLEWVSDLDPFPGLAAQTMLILAQISATALAAGGLARADAARIHEDIVIRIDAEGPRAGLHPESLDGLKGRDHLEGLAGRWAPSRYLAALVAGVGGVLTATADVGRFSLTATLPVAVTNRAA
jgi:hypothetical protein